MSTMLFRVLLVLPLALPIAPATAADDTDPEPVDRSKGETAVAAHTSVFSGLQAASARMQSSNNLKMIAIGLHSYHDAHNGFVDDIKDKYGKPLLSWRILLLPYLEQDKLYKEFKLDEPWDSDHNKKLLDKMPKVFASPRIKLKSKSNTVYQVFTGPNAVFGREKRFTFANITDGTSNTIFAVEATTATPWTKPGGIAFDRKKDLPDFGKAYGKKPLMAMLDGSVRTLDLTTVKPDTLKNAIDPADGNPLGKDWK